MRACSFDSALVDRGGHPTLTASQQPHVWRWDEIRSDPEHLQLLDGVAYEPGLFWEVIDLGAHWDKVEGVAPFDVRARTVSPHLGILAVTAHYPAYVPMMGGSSRPFLWVSGLRVTIGEKRWWYVPTVSWRTAFRGVSLFALYGGCGSSAHAVPQRRLT